MTAQMELGGLAPPHATDRIFFAVYPDTDTAAQIDVLSSSLRSRHGVRGTAIPAARLHVTLHHLGDHTGVSGALVSAAKRAGQDVDIPMFDISLTVASSFHGRPRRHPLVLTGEADQWAPLHDLHRRVGGQLHAHGLGQYVQRRFTPHLTLVYADSRIESSPIEPVVWTVREFALVHSLLGRGIHRVLARWPLRSG